LFSLFFSLVVVEEELEVFVEILPKVLPFVEKGSNFGFGGIYSSPFLSTKLIATFFETPASSFGIYPLFNCSRNSLFFGSSKGRKGPSSKIKPFL